MIHSNEQLISSIRVEKLFDLYTYRLPEKGNLTNAAILYGDNGVGKSTILRLAFHLLSSADNRNHRGSLYEASFKSLEVQLTSGVTLVAKREKKEDQKITLELAIIRENKTIVTWDWRPRSERGYETEDFIYLTSKNGQKDVYRKKPSLYSKNKLHPTGETAYLSFLSQLAPTIFILNADRRLDSDSVSDPSDEMELRKVMRYEEPKRINDLVSRSREIALSQAMSVAGRWVSRKAVQSANLGSENVHSVYVNVIRQLLKDKPVVDKTILKEDVAHLIGKLELIEVRTNELAKYELAAPLSIVDFVDALKRENKIDIAIELLKPYIDSLEGRLNAVEPIYLIIDRFVTVLNYFLTDKSITFKVGQGFSIQNKLGNTLDPSKLSSGEQQLLLLFCYILTARDKPSVFMIDEPEISLNIKWQRQLIQSLLDITDGANIQFIFASHSLELLSQHSNRVVTLKDD